MNCCQNRIEAELGTELDAFSESLMGAVKLIANEGRRASE